MGTGETGGVRPKTRNPLRIPGGETGWQADVEEWQGFFVKTEKCLTEFTKPVAMIRDEKEDGVVADGGEEVVEKGSEFLVVSLD